MQGDSIKADSLNWIAYQLHVNDPILGIEWALMAEAFADSIGYDIGIARANSNIGLGYYSLGDYPIALQYMLKSLDLYSEIGNTKGRATSHNNLGIIFRESADYEKAHENLQIALDLNSEAGNELGMAYNYWNLAVVSMEKQSWNSALSLFEKSLHLSEKDGTRPAFIMSTYSNMAIVYSEHGMDHRKGLEYAEKALSMAENSDQTFTNMEALRCYALLYKAIAENPDPTDLEELFNGDRNAAYQLAKSYLDSSIALAEQREIELMGYSNFKLLSEVEEALGNYRNALTQYRFYTLLKDSTFTLEKDKKLTQKSMQYEFDKKVAVEKEIQERKDLRQRVIRNSILAGLAATLAFALIVFRQRNRIASEKERSEELLLNILPEEVAQELKDKGEAEAQLIENVTVLFSDFKGFTALSEQLSPKELVKDLNECFSEFDRIMQKHGIEKIKTIGDAYMAAGGLPSPNTTHAQDVVKAALEMAQVVEKGKAEKKAAGLPFFEIRIGVHTGPVVAGIVGVKKFQYDIWGDTVNTASRMESSGEVGKVNISEATYELLKDDAQFSFESRGKVAAKGKGEMEMYFVSQKG